jgi:hypothetical protein
MTAGSQNLPFGTKGSEWPRRVGSVSSLMQEAAVRLLDAATVSNPRHCGRRTQPAPMSAMADYAKLLIMESSWPEPTQRADGQRQARIPAFA